MKRVIKVEVPDHLFLKCYFDTSDVRVIDISLSSKSMNIYPGVSQLFNPSVFSAVKVGRFGQVYWDNAATMRNERDEIIRCEYDLSPEFIWEQSQPINP